MKKFILSLGIALALSVPTFSQPNLEPVDGAKIVDIDKVPKEIKKEVEKICEKEKKICNDGKVYQFDNKTKKNQPVIICKYCFHWFTGTYCLFCKRANSSNK